MNYKIKPKPLILRLFTKPFQTVAFYPNIYTPDGTAPAKAVLEHELKHLEQQLDMGKWRFIYKYFTSKKFQFEMEVEGIAVELLHTPHDGRMRLAQNYAKLLASDAYSHCAPSYDAALVAICKAVGPDAGIAISNS